MSAVTAAITQADDATAYLARKLDDAAFELTRQSIRVRAGEPYSGRQVAQKLAAVTEAHEILDAYQENITRLLRAGARRSA